LFIQPYENYFRMFQAYHNFKLYLPVPDKISKTEMRQCHTAYKATDITTGLSPNFLNQEL